MADKLIVVEILLNPLSIYALEVTAKQAHEGRVLWLMLKDGRYSWHDAQAATDTHPSHDANAIKSNIIEVCL